MTAFDPDTNPVDVDPIAAHSLLPTGDAVRHQLTREELIDLRERVAAWIGPGVEAFRRAVARRLAEGDL